MRSRVFLHEWRALRADATLWVVVGVFALAIGYGVWNGARWVTFQRGALTAAVQEEADRHARLQQQIESLQRGESKVSSFADPRSPANAGGRLGPRYASLPPAPLAALAIGQSDLLPYYFKVSTDARETIVAATEVENPQRLLVGRFDLAFALIYLYPLLILGLTYNMLSAEKEQGTLALTLSQPISLATLVSGKVALRAAVLGAVVVSFATVALFASGADLGISGAPVRLLLWAAAVVAYGAFWFAIAVVVSALGRSSATNATILASVWLALVVVLPSLLNLAATSGYPVPSRVEMIQAMREASDEANKAGSTLLATYYEDHPELASGGAEQAMNDFSIIRVAVADEVERRVRPVVQRYETQIARQQQMVARLRFLSPAVLMQDALNDIAGTGTPRHQEFMRQVATFHEAWRGHFTPLIVRKAQVLSYAELPRFAFAEEPTRAVVSRVAISLAGLVLPATLVAAFGLRTLRRYPVVG
jgi:ABC-2 type transport system permease protein